MLETFGLGQSLKPFERFVARHPKALMGGLLSLLGAFGVTAFGIAPLVPQERTLSVQAVEALAVPSLDEQLAALADGSPNGPAAGPERKVTTPIRNLPFSAATAAPLKPAAAMARASGRVLQCCWRRFL